MNAWLRSLVLVAAVAVTLTAASAAFALKLTPTSPRNGHVVAVDASAPVTFVHLTIAVDLAGCFINPGVQPYAVELFTMHFAPLNGRGQAFSTDRGLLEPDHKHLIESFTSESPTVQLSGDVSLGSVYLADGEVLRWTLPAQCADAIDPNTTDRAVATGTIRISKQASGSPAPRPVTKVPPSKEPQARRPRHTGTTALFLITRIDSPSSVQQNGPRAAAAIHWSGQPTFPVTMHDAAASCPPGLTCSSESRVAATRANPLTWDVWWCSGSVTSSWTLDFWFWLTDAKGLHTQKVRKQVMCDAG